MNNISICRKKSGNYIISKFPQSVWEIVATASTPKELKSELTKLGGATVIVAEYSRAQIKSPAVHVTEKQILKAFGFHTTKKEIELYFN